MRTTRWMLPWVGLALAACSGPEAWLDPAGPGAEATSTVTRVLFWVGGAVYVVVMALAVVGVVRAHRRHRGRSSESESDDPRAARNLVVVAGALVPALVLLGVNVFTVPMSASVGAFHEGDGELVVDVTAEQFWWRVDYPQLDVRTANEIHVPTDTEVRLRITSDDVIHSFWLPKLAGKVDATPGHVTELVLQADEPGRHTGRCTEYCGLAHAQMQIHLVAQATEEFETWAEQQATPQPWSVDHERGREIFLSSSCVYCHAVDGHGPPNTIGPDLTHLASRETIAGGVLPNTTATLGGWIVDPQSLKPGTRMPGTQLAGEELRELLDYLTSLE